MSVEQTNQTKYVENQYIFNGMIDKRILLITQVKQYTSFVITVYVR